MCSELVNIENGFPTTDRIIPKVRPTTSREVTVTFHPKKAVVPALIFVALVAVVIIVWQVLLKKEAAPTFPDEPTIAVLPFTDLSPKKDQEIFCESISEYIITKLTKLKGLKVIQGDSVLHYKDSGKGPQSIGKELGVDAILYGIVQSSGNNLTVVPKLMNVADASIIWADEFTEPAGDALDIQGTIALQIAENLQAELTSDDRERIEKKPTENLEAYNLYLRGRHFWRKRGNEDVLKSIQYFEHAIAKDPNFALAYAGLADSYISLTWGSQMEEAKNIKEYALKALELDNSLAQAHVALAMFKLENEWDFRGAKQEFERAITLNPGYATAHHWYGRYYWWTGDTDKAIAEMMLAQELDPLSPSIYRNLALSYTFAEQYDLALKALNRVLEIDPNHVNLHFHFAIVYLGKAMYAEALEEANIEFGPDSLLVKYWEMLIYAIKGETDTAREWIEQIEERTDLEGIISPSIMALLWSTLDEKEKVFLYLDKAYEIRDVNMFWINALPFLDEYRSDPRYEQLLKKMGLK